MATATKTAHTPGPWETGCLLTRVEVTPPGWRMPMCIADCDAQHSPEREQEKVANARLIAASPCLYDYVQLKAKEGCKHAKEIISTIWPD